MNKKQASQVTQYILNWLEGLDGKGIVFEDSLLVKKQLKDAEEVGYPALEQIIKGD